MTLNKITLVSGVQVHNTSSVYCIMFTTPEIFYYNICLVRTLQLNKNTDSEIRERWVDPSSHIYYTLSVFETQLPLFKEKWKYPSMNSQS